MRKFDNFASVKRIVYQPTPSNSFSLLPAKVNEMMKSVEVDTHL